MNYEVFITAAVTGSGDTAGKSDKVPVTPKEIADFDAEFLCSGCRCVTTSRMPAKTVWPGVSMKVISEKQRSLDVEISVYSPL